ncbi:MAG: hypothetical protein NTV36_03535, partial [Candidatus Staskawiczbacteria bacterium]|nr:hypothetical protein [Candidatus Staskawiczbacteria bacterium]
ARKEIIKKICDKYKLPAYGYTDLLEPYVYYNVPFSFQSYERNFGLLEVDELKNYIRKSAQGNKEELYPIMIKISPYASKNDLIDFVKNKFVWENEIEPLRDKYKDKNIKIGKFKTKNEKIKERNDFVYENRHLPRIKIMKLVNDKFEGCVGYEYVNKIIALEDRKRKDVNS